MKEFAPIESKFFSFRIDHFSEESQNNFSGAIAPESFFDTSIPPLSPLLELLHVPLTHALNINHLIN